MLIALHFWTAFSTYEVLGDFGWLYSDFFLPQNASQLAYTGIYRFLNNPEVRPRLPRCDAPFSLYMSSSWVFL
jgi:hypothetical protein